jgi:hypothetical protein
MVGTVSLDMAAEGDSQEEHLSGTKLTNGATTNLLTWETGDLEFNRIYYFKRRPLRLDPDSLPNIQETGQVLRRSTWALAQLANSTWDFLIQNLVILSLNYSLLLFLPIVLCTNFAQELTVLRTAFLLRRASPS